MSRRIMIMLFWATNSLIFGQIFDYKIDTDITSEDVRALETIEESVLLEEKINIDFGQNHSKKDGPKIFLYSMKGFSF